MALRRVIRAVQGTQIKGNVCQTAGRLNASGAGVEAGNWAGVWGCRSRRDNKSTTSLAPTLSRPTPPQPELPGQGNFIKKKKKKKRMILRGCENYKEKI